MVSKLLANKLDGKKPYRMKGPLESVYALDIHLAFHFEGPSIIGNKTDGPQLVGVKTQEPVMHGTVRARTNSKTGDNRGPLLILLNSTHQALSASAHVLRA